MSSLPCAVGDACGAVPKYTLASAPYHRSCLATPLSLRFSVMRMLPHLLLMIGSTAAVAGCQERVEPPPLERPAGDVIQGAPAYQPAVLVGTSSSAEAFEMTFKSPSPPDSVAEWYRQRADERGWEILGDVRAPDGSISMTFKRDGPGLWLLVREGPDGEGTEFSLIGAARDSTLQEP